MRQHENAARYTMQKCMHMKATVLFLVARADPFFVLGRQSALREAAVVGADNALVEIGYVDDIDPDIFHPDVKRNWLRHLASPTSP